MFYIGQLVTFRNPSNLVKAPAILKVINPFNTEQIMCEVVSFDTGSLNGWSLQFNQNALKPYTTITIKEL